MWSGIQLAILIFSLRIVDISLYTLRLLTLRRGRKALAFAFAFFQSIFFVTAIRAILTNLDKPIVILGYSAGFATGLVVGMLIEAKLAIGYTHLRIISAGRGIEITECLRNEGFAVTEIACRGRDGNVTLLNCHILRKDTEQVVNLVANVDENSFITAENVVSARHGFWHHRNPVSMH